MKHKIKRANNVSISEYVASQLRERILSNAIKPGEPLKQTVIAEQLGVSIIPVREAFRQLEAEGVVELLPRRGVVAAHFTLEKVLEWLNIRRLVEPDILGRAIDTMREEDIKTAEDILARLNGALDAHRDVHTWSALNWSFHEALYRPARQPETLALLATLHQKCDRYHRLQLLDETHIVRAEQEHDALLDCCRNGRKREAKALIVAHIKGVEADLKKELRAKSNT
ncbi:MAG: GntR family transcriptional regulator [Pseudomonadota bacterium]